MSDNGTAYCIECGKKTEYSINVQLVTMDICGVRFKYIEQEAHCAKCWEPIYVPEINDSNVDSRVKAFEEARQKLRHKIGSNGGKS